MINQHHYTANIQWTGNTGEGTTHYRSYSRNHTIQCDGKSIIEASSDPAFLGNPAMYNPEDLLLASLSSCHMLWYLHLCADNGVVVTAYNDNAIGTMEENENGGRFTEVVLFPKVKVANAAMIEKAIGLHSQAHKKCFIANSCNFPVKHQPEVYV